MKRVLAPLDGTEKAETALPYLRQVCMPGDEIVLLAVRKPAEPLRVGSAPGHVVRGGIAGPSGGVMGVVTPDVSVFNETKDQALDRQRTETEEYLENHAADLRKMGYTVRTQVIIDDDAGEAIVKFARQLEPNIIVMLRRTHFNVGSVVFGSVASHVVHADLAPVIFVPSA